MHLMFECACDRGLDVQFSLYDIWIHNTNACLMCIYASPLPVLGGDLAQSTTGRNHVIMTVLAGDFCFVATTSAKISLVLDLENWLIMSLFFQGSNHSWRKPIDYCPRERKLTVVVREIPRCSPLRSCLSLHSSNNHNIVPAHMNAIEMTQKMGMYVCVPVTHLHVYGVSVHVWSTYVEYVHVWSVHVWSVHVWSMHVWSVHVWSRCTFLSAYLLAGQLSKWWG